ncbi:MAG: ATP-binding protein [Acidobacteriota bacterium]
MARIKLSIYKRLIFWITLLVCVLVGAILFVIQKLEVRVLEDAALARAGLVARYMADLNQQPLVKYDKEAIQKNVDEWTDGTHASGPTYIIICNRDGEPYVVSFSASVHPEILSRTQLDENGGPEEVVSERKRIRLGGRWLRVLEFEIPVFLPGQSRRWASVKIGHSLEPMYADLRQVQLVLVLVAVGGILLGIAGATVLAKRITRPIKKLADGTVRLAKGDFSHTIDIPPGDELGELAGSFNDMTGELLRMRERMAAANRNLVQAEKLASIGRLSVTIAHEIRNPLTSVKLNIQKIAQDGRLDEADREHLGLSMEGIGQIEKFIKELLFFTRVADLSLERFPVEQVLEESFKMLRDVLDEKGIRVEKSYAAGLPPLLVDGDKMRQVFLNVLRNAEEALDAGGRISVATDRTEEGGQKWIRVRISDDGPGIPDKDRDNIFEPFFTTKPSGFGLGLATARKIIDQHNGSIKLAGRGEGGTSFVILIPCEEET